MIRVSIAAPSLALRIGLREMLREMEKVEVVSVASTIDELADCDVMLLTSVDYLSDLIEDAPAILLLSDRTRDASKLLDFPVWGILSMDASSEEISAAIHSLAEGLLVGSPAFIQSLLTIQPEVSLVAGEPVVDPLTQREREVLQLVAEGLANKQIALALEISEHTVKFHLSSLYSKLSVTSRTEAIREGARRGWVVL